MSSVLVRQRLSFSFRWRDGGAVPPRGRGELAVVGVDVGRSQAALGASPVVSTAALPAARLQADEVSRQHCVPEGYVPPAAAACLSDCGPPTLAALSPDGLMYRGCITSLQGQHREMPSTDSQHDYLKIVLARPISEEEKYSNRISKANRKAAIFTLLPPAIIAQLQLSPFRHTT